LASTPRAYVDACLFLNVLRQESGLWRPALKVLRAVSRGDIRIVASRLLAVEVARFRGDHDRLDVDAFALQRLEGMNPDWYEVDLLVSREARRLSWEHQIRSGADAIHLATAVRAQCDYFISSDNVFPYGATIDKTAVIQPAVVWDPTTEDLEIDDMPEPEPLPQRP
jgi:predicted nucleic acid-binding protein